MSVDISADDSADIGITNRSGDAEREADWAHVPFLLTQRWLAQIRTRLVV